MNQTSIRHLLKEGGITQQQYEDIKEREPLFMTDADLRRYFPDNADESPIIKYSALANVKNITDILPHDKSFKVILIENRHNIGHWVVISRNKDTIYFFDSYSNKPDGQLRYINSFWRKMLGQDETYLTALLDKAKKKGWKIKYNKNRLQSLKGGGGTCGRWVILWLMMNLQFKYNLDDFEKFVDKNRKELGLTRDELVTLWVR
jgi:hypothetical protein